MAKITIQKPFDIEVKGEAHFDCLPDDEKGQILATVGDIKTFEYVQGGNTYELPTGGTATSEKGTSEARLDNLGDVDTGGDPPNPFTISFNSGTAYRIPSSGSPYKVKLEEVDADLEVTGAASSETYGSGGVVRLDAGGTGNPTRKSS